MDQTFKTSRYSHWPTVTTIDNDQVAGEYATNGTTLGGAVRLLSSWATPTTRDHKDGACQEIIRQGGVAVNAILGRQVATIGTELNGSPAQTGKPGQLNPAFSLWLMGFPPEWENYAPQATRLSRKSRRNLFVQQTKP